MKEIVALGLIVIAILIVVLSLVNPGPESSGILRTFIIVLTVLLTGGTTYGVYVIWQKQRRKQVIKLLLTEISEALERLNKPIPIPVHMATNSLEQATKIIGEAVETVQNLRHASFETTGKIMTFVGTGLVNSGDIFLLHSEEMAKFAEAYGRMESYNRSEERAYEYYTYRGAKAQQEEWFIEHCERHSARRKFLIKTLSELKNVLQKGLAE